MVKWCVVSPHRELASSDLNQMGVFGVHGGTIKGPNLVFELHLSSYSILYSYIEPILLPPPLKQMLSIVGRA